MADAKITDLTEHTTPIETDILPIVDVTNVITKKITIANLLRGDSSILQTATISISSAQILAMKATPIVLLAAPGAGKIIILNDILTSFTYNSIAYVGGYYPKIIYLSSNNTINSTPISNAQIIGTVNVLFSVYSNVSGGFSLNASINDSIVLTQTGAGEFTSGNSTMKIFLKYRVITL